MAVNIPLGDTRLSVQVDDDTVWLIFHTDAGKSVMLNMASIADKAAAEGFIKAALNQWFNERVDQAKALRQGA
jgi:hypothetical protein